ncbi:MAG: diacylglycerol kinase family protein [Streptococcaceae bacterium]|jgi:undecaprenol kinase|nr:diacylglycerol kinase family protein [Streptococcaceae bacterium]
MDLHGNKKKYKNVDFLSSFDFALNGLKTVVREERNMRKHLISTVVAIVFGFVFQLGASEWLWLLWAVFSVLILETLNTVVENIVDLATNYHFHILAKSAKDMAAGAVLLASIFAVIVGMVLFIPRIIELVMNFL